MGDSMVQLRSDSYKDHLLGEMQQLRLLGQLCDITVQVDFQGELEEFEAHQVLLAASSGYFKDIILGKDPPTKIFLGSVPTADFSRFLEFVYTAQLQVEESKASDILAMAKLLDCRGLVAACVQAAAPSSQQSADTLQDRRATDTLEHHSVTGVLAADFLEDGLGETPSPSMRGQKRSSRLAGRRVPVGATRKKSLRKPAAKRQVPDPQTEPDPVEGPLGQEGPLGREGPSGKADGSGTEMSEEPLEPVEFDDRDPAEKYAPGEADFQMEEDEEKREEEEEEEEEKRSRREKRKKNGQFHCEKCQRSFHYEKSYLKHVSSSHGEAPEVEYRCPTCAQTFANRCNLKIHERHVHSDERLFPCSVCSKAFKRRKDVKRHCRQVHEGGGDRHACPVCAKSLSSKTALLLHQRTHTGDRPYHCTDCSAKFSQSSALKTHRRTHTGEKPFACDQCDARFTQNHMLSYHKRCHTGEKPFMCESCGKSFASKEYLKHHARIHSGSKPYKCEICGRAFAQRNSLHQHMKIHTGERPYSCEVCGKQFTQLNALQRHNRIHTGEKPYMCLLCNRTFTDKSTVRRHTMTHDKDTPWKNYLVVLQGNMEGGRKVTKRGGAKNKESSAVVSGEGVGPVAKQEEGGVAVPQAQPVTLAGDWPSAGHGAITLVSHTALGGFTLIQTDSTPTAATQVIALETAGGTVPLQVPVSVSAPLSIQVPGSAPFTIPISVSLPACTSVSITAASPALLPVPVSAPLPVPVSAPLPVPVSAPLPVPVSASLPVPVSAPLPDPVSAPLPVPVSAPLPVPVPAPLPVPVSAQLPVPVSAPLPDPVAVALSVCETAVSGDVCVSVPLELDTMQDPPPSESGHLGGTEDVSLEAIAVETMETMEVSSEDRPSPAEPLV
ncbi:GDNF-inducible zinc finger protein 1 [Conger conger]|uniref:GDNF-inducible zinc finger protein 1 n=1 Tax=Conger conger TaxID=82655 RepID=UPI002A5ACAE8|nr:GDNF-inducible zinc finger protein 1 [Conger conger]